MSASTLWKLTRIPLLLNCLCRRRALSSALASKKIFSFRVREDHCAHVPPVRHTSPGARLALRCCRRTAWRTAGCRATAEAALATCSWRMSAVRSAPFSRRRPALGFGIHALGQAGQSRFVIQANPPQPRRGPRQLDTERRCPNSASPAFPPRPRPTRLCRNRPGAIDADHGCVAALRAAPHNARFLWLGHLVAPSRRIVNPFPHC